MKESFTETGLYPDIAVGVTTNSDDRVPSILSSLGLDVSPLRWEAHDSTTRILEESKAIRDIDFTVLSYDVGFEKPSHEIFDAARILGDRCLNASDSHTTYVHIGDDLEKDVRAALSAGWGATLLDREGKYPSGSRMTDLMGIFGNGIEVPAWKEGENTSS